MEISAENVCFSLNTSFFGQKICPTECYLEVKVLFECQMDGCIGF